MSVLNKVAHYQRKIERSKENTQVLTDCINKLDSLPVTVRHLEKTGIGKTINALRKLDGEVGNVAKDLVWKWKSMVIEQALAEEKVEKDRRLRDPTVSSSDEKLSNSDGAEDEPTIEYANSELSSTTATGATSDVVGVNTCEEECTSSTASQNFDVSTCENDYYETLPSSTETEDNMQVPTNSTSQPVPLNHNSRKDEKEKHGHRSRHHHNEHSHHSSKHRSSSHHHHSRRDKPKEKKETKHDKAEASGSGSSTQEDKCKVKIKKERVDTDNHSHDKKGNKSSSSGSSKHKQHSKRSHSEHETSEKKHSHKEREQKRKHSSGDPEDIPKHSKSSEKAKKMKINIADDDGIDCFSGASFAEALGMGDARKKKKSSSSAASAGGSSFSGGSSSHKKHKSSTSTRETAPPKPKLLSADAKLEPLNVEDDIASSLPKISPNYRPLPEVSPSIKYKKARLSEESQAYNQAVAEAISLKQQRTRTKVYSGVKARGPIPSLYDLCVYVLKDNIDALEYTGGVPYDILKPILQQATPEQLFQLEFYNEYLIADTDELWEFHCRKFFRTGQRRSDETAREMYLRCTAEREAKLKALTSNIQQSLANSTPVRQTKLAYLDDVAKPPRNVARQQAKYGTGTTPKSVAKSGKGTSGPKPSTSTSGASTSGSSHRATASGSRVKPRMAPLMQKTMKLARSFKRLN